jgi:hypothetical protein
MINPMVFWYIEMIGNLDQFNKALSFVLVWALILTAGFRILLSDNDWIIKFAVKRNFIIMTSVTFISLFLVCIVPSKTTMYKMMIANEVTLENYEKVKSEGKKLIDYAVDKINESKNGDRK